MKLGSLKLAMFNGGDFLLDGGAMHGVVPKTLWSRLVQVDDLNRVGYSTNCLLVESAGQRILIEVGNGDKFNAKDRAIYGIDHDLTIAKALAQGGVPPESIDLVILTHLHFDHVGGATRREGAAVVPVFPNARHLVQARELEDATHPHERNRASYLREDLEPLLEAGLFETVTGEAEVAPGVRLLPTPGHTVGHQSVLLEGGDDGRALFLGDLVPTAVHVRLPFIMAYDLEPAVTLETKRQIFARAMEEHWLLIFGHDLDHHGARLRLGGAGRPEVESLVQIT